ncbi:oxidoreductase [Salipaludibacillus keqinensis]|uniref:Oxidoreductase n=1 Tax=Salipaludibacillus keqinensis TaxID=2045207 RepID=A0A323T844_9BACI|nr:iron-containing alcohol dehydrogenase family protein [Salipaludibacillus keqinensis]PYZ91759.1 oxidoreductase [Salipaludibacillus keqinensis]
MDIKVQGAPNIYICEQGALDKLKDEVEKQNFHKGMVIHGTKSWEVGKEFIEPLQLNTVNVPYSGECSKEEVSRLSKIFASEEADYIIGVGGGKVMDLAKATAHEMNVPHVLVPTLASNCSPWTSLSVFYSEKGKFVKYEVFPKNAFMVVVDPNLIVDSPVEYLRAGIGDTIAKWYEAEVLVKPLSVKPLSVDISLHAARLCRDVLIDEGAVSIEALKKNEVSVSFVKVIETIIMAGGMVGGFGDRFGRIAGAHSIHNGLTVIDNTHNFLHGEKVAYGILVQLAMERRFDEIERLYSYYLELKLPVSLQDLGIVDNISDAIKRIAHASTKEGESILLMAESAASSVEVAMKELETFIYQKKQSTNLI